MAVSNSCFHHLARPGGSRTPPLVAAQAERYADALGIAALPGAGPELFAKAQQRHMAATPRPYMLLARCIMDQDFRCAASHHFVLFTCS